MDEDVPNEAGEGDPPGEGLPVVDRAMEEHEMELFAALKTRLDDRLRPEASEEDRRVEAIAILIEDPEALDLYKRLSLLESFGGGGFRRKLLERRNR